MLHYSISSLQDTLGGKHLSFVLSLLQSLWTCVWHKPFPCSPPGSLHLTLEHQGHLGHHCESSAFQRFLKPLCFILIKEGSLPEITTCAESELFCFRALQSVFSFHYLHHHMQLIAAKFGSRLQFCQDFWTVWNGWLLWDCFQCYWKCMKDPFVGCGVRFGL